MVGPPFPVVGHIWRTKVSTCSAEVRARAGGEGGLVLRATAMHPLHSTRKTDLRRVSLPLTSDAREQLEQSFSECMKESRQSILSRTGAQWL